MANTYSDLTGSTVAANYNKSAASSALGTRSLRFFKVTAVHSAAPVDFGKATLAAAGVYTASESIWNSAIRALQGFVEVYIYFVPGTAGFMVAVADDTAQDSDAGTNAAGGYGDIEAAIKDACAIDTSVTCTVVGIAGTGVSIS
jgi:hypothetical protein